MPVIEFTGVEARRGVILELIGQIKNWVASVKSLEVDIEYVTPMYIPSIQEHSGRCVVFYVQELFTESFTGKSRTTEIRKELAQAIEKGFNAFVATGKLLVEPRSMTVVTRMVDREKWEYHSWNIPESSKGKPPDDGHNFFDGVERGPRD